MIKGLPYVLLYLFGGRTGNQTAQQRWQKYWDEHHFLPPMVLERFVLENGTLYCVAHHSSACPEKSCN